MKKQIVRAYKGTDIQMLSVCDIIADHAIENLPALEASNAAWNNDFFQSLKTLISGLLTGFFGIKSGTELKNITDKLVAIQASLLKHLTMLHTQIDSNYKDDRKRQTAILAQLGYTGNWNKAKNENNQTSLITLLEIFEKGCTDELYAELTGKRVSGTSIQYIRGNMRQMYDLNIRQEGLKDSRKLITQDIIARFNEVYNSTMSYARSAQTLFSDKPVLKKEFTYSHILRQLSPSHGSPGNNQEPPAGPVE